MRSRLAATVIAAAAALAACGGSGTTTTEAGAPSGVDGPLAISPSDADAANDQVDFVATDIITGDQVDVGALSQNDLVIWFWAPW